MRQKVIVVVMSCAFASPAIAEVTISGMVNVGPLIASSTRGIQGTSTPITYANNQDSDRIKEGFWKHRVASNNSRINLNSDYSLTNWLTVLFQYQLDISDTGGSASNVGSALENAFLLRSRNSFVGLTGPSWGAIKFGTNENIYEQYLYEADPLDNATGIGGNLQIFGSPGYGVVFDVGQMNMDPQRGQAGFYRRTDQNIWYESPNWMGASFSASYSANAYQKGALDQPYKPQVMSVGAQYKPGYLPFYVNVAYEVHKDLFGMAIIAGTRNGGHTSKDTGIKAQAGVTIGPATVGAIIEQLEYTVAGTYADGIPVKSPANFSEYKRRAFGVHAKLVVPFGYFGLNLALAQDGKYRQADEFDTITGQTTKVGATGSAMDSGARYIGAGYFHNVGTRTQFQLIGTIVQNKASSAYALPSYATCNLGVAGADHKALYAGIKYSF